MQHYLVQFYVVVSFSGFVGFLNFFWVSCLFDLTVYEDFYNFFSDAAAHFPCLIIHSNVSYNTYISPSLLESGSANLRNV